MIGAGWRVAITRTLKIHRGEESRVFSFFGLHVLLSVVIGMISTVVDPLVITHRADGTSAAMYGAAALILFVIGLFYAGITDRIDKRRLFSFALILSFVICIGAGMLLFVDDAVGGVPFLLSGLFVWRFVIGILLLLIFWDLAPFYFDARQGKRLFPLLAIGGALGYSGGSLLVVPLARVLPVGLQLFAIGFVTVFCVIGFWLIRGRFSILDSPRYRDRSIREELREGLTAFRGNRFLRAVGWNTIVFGFLSGLIILTYNAVIDARTTTGTEAASLMGFQRAGATILQAVVLTKVMSQSALGGKHKNAVVMQILFFALGIVAFAISMVGVADFTRQIEVALMSPAAMAAFAFLPSQYRGRVMVLNNVGAAALGILAATVFVLFVGPHVSPLWFIYPIAALMVIRLGFNFVLNRRYVALLSESLLADNRLNLARIEENTGSILRDETLLNRLYRETQAQSPSIQMFIAGRLARGASTTEDIERIQPFFELVTDTGANDSHDEAEFLQTLKLQTLARVDFERYRPEIEQGSDSRFRNVRIEARFQMLQRQLQHDSTIAAEQHIRSLQDEFDRATISTGFREICDVVLRLEHHTGHRIIVDRWHTLDKVRREAFLAALADHPVVYYFDVLVDVLTDALTNAHTDAIADAITDAHHDVTRRGLALRGLRGMPESMLQEKRQSFTTLGPAERLHLLQEMQQSHPAFARQESVDLLSTFLQSIGERQFITLFDRLHRDGEQITDAALLVLSDPAPAPAHVNRAAYQAVTELTTLFPGLFSLRLDTPELMRTRYSPLLKKILDEKLRDLSVLILTLSSVTLPKEDDRVLAWSICRELRDRTSPIKQNALEFIETRIGGDARNYLLVFFETLTEGEKRARIRSLLKTPPGGASGVDATGALRELRDYYDQNADSIPAEILTHVGDESRLGLRP